MRDLTEGSRLADRYTLRRRLGRGGMGELWLAADRRADAPVALKFLDPERAGQRSDRDRFRDEWRTASRLMHAHIVRVFEYHDDEDGPFYALQYVDGPAISALAGGSLDAILRPLGLLADALRYAHGKGIVHGDVTAANVLLDGRGAPYLTDFGLARSAGSASSGGTPAALSPERRAGEPLDPADDVYAFGVLMHELLFNRPPGDAGLPDTTAGGEALPGAVRRLLERVLAARRDGRPAAGELAAALADAGFPAGPAPLRRAAAATDDAEVTVRSVRPTRAAAAPAAAAPSAASRSRGVPLPVVLAGLALLLLAFIGVLYVLPPDDPAGPLADAPPEAAVADDILEPADDGATEGPDADDAVEDLAPFSENLDPARAGQVKAATDEALGDLLSRLERLRYRGIERWGGEEYEAALERYAEGDRAYIDKDFARAGEAYRATIGMLDPFFDRIDAVFRETMREARAAFERRDHREAIRLYDLAVAITPGNPEAERGLQRAQTLEDVLALMQRGESFEESLEYDAARAAYNNALELDPAWQPAQDALERVRAALERFRFEQLMTDGFDALAEQNFDSARAAFEAAKSMRPASEQPVAGLLQVDQAVRLARTRTLEAPAAEHEANERWEAAVDAYEAALEVDPDLQFAKDGLARAGQRAALHRQIEEYIGNPDSLSSPPVMQAATNLLLSMSRITPAGPRLEDQKETLSRLLKRAATPLTVELRSDNATRVSIYKVGNLGSFDARRLELRPGSYVAVGSRPGYRDVRLEFRVAPEIDMEPIVVQCEERI